MRELGPTLLRNKRLVGLFVLMVLLPTFVFSLLIVRAIKNEQVGLAYQAIERQRQVVDRVEADLKGWLFASGPQSAMTLASVRFEIAGDDVRFPDFGLTLSTVETRRVRPFETAAPSSPLTADVVASQFYPRIQAFLRDANSGRHAGAQYFLRLRGLVVRPPGSAGGYVVDVERVVDYVNDKLGTLCASEAFIGTVWVPEADQKTIPAGVSYGLHSFPFFEIVFASRDTTGGLSLRRHAFAAAMTLLVSVTVLGSLFLHRALSQEVRLSRLRNEFVAAVSHEFRSPLSSIVALSERLVAQRSIAPDTLAEYHRIIDHDARRLSALVTRLLEFGRIEDGKAAFTLAATDLMEVTQDALTSVGPAVHVTRIHWSSAGPRPMRIRADRVALSLAIQNLIENAAKYSPAESPIEVTCRSDPASHVVEIRDHGIGIAASEQQRIFEKFYRGRAVVELNVQGVGIGLALVKQTVEQHGGRVAVESRLGEGSCFRLSLPRAEG